MPIYVSTSTFQVRKEGKPPKVTVYIDGPFYPDKTVSRREAQAKLCREIKETMKMRAKEYDSSPDCRFNYIKVDTPEDVRTEIA